MEVVNYVKKCKVIASIHKIGMAGYEEIER